jgi:hypothetical protein
MCSHFSGVKLLIPGQDISEIVPVSGQIVSHPWITRRGGVRQLARGCRPALVWTPIVLSRFTHPTPCMVRTASSGGEV